MCSTVAPKSYRDLEIDKSPSIPNELSLPGQCLVIFYHTVPDLLTLRLTIVDSNTSIPGCDAYVEPKKALSTYSLLQDSK